MRFSNNAIGIQDFEKIRVGNTFYVDKTDFIREWWKNGSDVTLITRPRRFGKTLNMSMLDYFFSNKYEGRSDLFEGLSISENEEMMALQGTFPVISLSFATIKSDSYDSFKEDMADLLYNLYKSYPEIEMSPFLANIHTQLDECRDVTINDNRLSRQLYDLCQKLQEYHGKKVMIFLDEYDTPMHEAYVYGYWDEVVAFMRTLFNATFKTNNSLYRAVMTGITRVSRESMFSDFNNPDIVTTSSEKYATAFGFTEAEVFEALDEHGLSDQKDLVKKWYDGFNIGSVSDIYNPWSIINYLSNRRVEAYWANTSSNSLAGKLIREGDFSIKQTMEDLLKGIPLVTEIDEQIVFSDLEGNANAVWSLFLASGYLKVDERKVDGMGLNEYTLSLTNLEVKLAFEKMISGWFKSETAAYNGFIKALLKDDKEAMNAYMNKIALNTFSSFDVGNKPSEQCEPERFYHGFVLGLLVDLRGDYVIHSNRESGYGRYDVMLEPLKAELSGIVIEFKVFNSNREKTLEDTVKAALAQIDEKGYDSELVEKGVSKERIVHYGFAFEGKKVLIG